MFKLNEFKREKYVVITGASGGIGYELAKVFAQNGFNLILVARSGDKLQKIIKELTDQYPINAYAFIHDLSVVSEMDAFYHEVKARKLDVFILINNAGFGYWGSFEHFDPDRQIKMLNLNIIGLTHLTRLFVNDMIDAGFGKIMNVASIAAFQPMALLATYAAAKTYVLYFSQALDVELEGKNISVSVLCPPDVKTGFQAQAGNSNYKPFGPLANSAGNVAKIAFRQFLKNRKIIKPWKISGKIIMSLSHLFPLRMAMKNRMKMHQNRLLPKKSQ